jgi:hypothetical protein
MRAIDATPLTTLATAQHGTIRRQQLLDLGWSSAQIGRLLDVGWLVRLHRGVYAVGHSALREEGRFLAAAFASGPRAVVSHTSASTLWRIWRVDEPVVHVTGAAVRGNDVIVGHRSRNLQRHHRTALLTVPVTTLPRTLVDLADLVSLDDLVRAAATAHRERRLRPAALAQAIEDHPGRRGAGALRQLLDDGLLATRSEFERRFLRLCKEQGWPAPIVNQIVLGYRADFCWADRGVIVEADGFDYHADRFAFEDDHDRDLAWTTAGWQVRRVTWRQLTRTPSKVRRAVRPLVAGGVAP